MAEKVYKMKTKIGVRYYVKEKSGRYRFVKNPNKK